MFLGTASSAQTSPAAIRPFGMVSPGPLNQPKAPCGYNNRIKELLGFNHTHLQGTGCGSYGLLVLLPTIGNKELGTQVDVPNTQQWAEPGYYKAFIQSKDISIGNLGIPGLSAKGNGNWLSRVKGPSCTIFRTIRAKRRIWLTSIRKSSRDS